MVPVHSADLPRFIKDQTRRKTVAAVRKGHAKAKTAVCEGCGYGNKPLQLHHDDYRNPLDIRYLCDMCHNRADNTMRGEVEFKGTLGINVTDPEREAFAAAVKRIRCNPRNVLVAFVNSPAIQDAVVQYFLSLLPKAA